MNHIKIGINVEKLENAHKTYQEFVDIIDDMWTHNRICSTEMQEQLDSAAMDYFEVLKTILENVT